MNNRFVSFTTVFLLVINIISFGQSKTVTLSGKVTDEKTGEVLPFANVFINNSSIGTTTNENGQYTLGNLPIGNIEIAVSFLGYTTIKQTLRFEQPGMKTVTFKMREGMELAGVTIYSKKGKKREQYLKILSQQLLGEGKFSKLSKILNPEVINISMEDNGHILARSNSPVKIENKALGYYIYQDLDDFDFYEGKLYYGGSTRFELMKPSSEQEQKKWRANQKEAYQGSLKQLLTSMVTDSVRENGFKIFQEIPDSLRMFSSVRSVNGYNPIKNHIHNRLEEINGHELIQPGELETELLVVSGTKLEVFNLRKRGRTPYTDMSFGFTQITLPQGYFVITPQGWVIAPMGFELAGDLGNNRFSSLLPADWKRD